MHSFNSKKKMNKRQMPVSLSKPISYIQRHTDTIHVLMYYNECNNDDEGWHSQEGLLSHIVVYIWYNANTRMLTITIQRKIQHTLHAFVSLIRFTISYIVSVILV